MGDEEESSALLTLTCQRDRISGEFLARELMVEQTSDNLLAFGDRLKAVHDKFLLGTPQCKCIVKPL